ncbi:Elongation factor G [Anoxybacillus sp. BCO1]|nr:Elongation factor G [Anoxybacillus sp. BCO1]
MCAYHYHDELGKNIERIEIPEDYRDMAEEYRGKLIEAVAELDEELMMRYLEGKKLRKKN